MLSLTSMITPVNICPGELKEYIGNFDKFTEQLSLIKESICLIDPTEVKPVFANKSILQILGYTNQQIDELGLMWPKKITHPDDYDHLTSHISNFKKLAPNTRSRVVYRVKNAKGKWSLIESTSISLASKKSRKTQIILSITLILPKDKVADYTKSTAYHNHRCKNCKKLLGMENLSKAEIEIKCSRCGEFNMLKNVIDHK